MNVKSGLLRLWVVASAAWVFFVAVRCFHRWSVDPWGVVDLSYYGTEHNGLWADIAGIYQLVAANLPSMRLSLYGFWAVAVPVVVLVVGYAMTWVVRGFRPPKVA